MGRGSKSRESGVQKQIENFSEGGGGGNTTEAEKDPNNCLFAFRFSLNIPTAEATAFKKGEAARLNKDHTGTKLEVIIGTQTLATYQGKHEERLKNCINRNYIYEGTLVAIEENNESSVLIVELRGRGR